LTRGRGDPEPVPTPYRLGRARPDHGLAIGRLFAHAFDVTERVAPVVASIVDRPGWHVLAALDGDTPVGMGALFVQDRLGCLPFAATHPDHRRRGIQGALMGLRIQTALDLGCELITTETGEEVPGEPNPSGNNMFRHGFRRAETLHNYRPPNRAAGDTA
ncbi:MAG: GNAT family N-acetyltransferase, partial [Myxococcota bacterium]